MAAALAAAGGAAVLVVLWLAQEPDGAPMWEWQAWRVPDLSATWEHLRIHVPGDGLPVRRHDGSHHVWPDQGTRADVADVAAIRAARDFASWRPVVAAGAAVGAGVALVTPAASRAPSVPYVAHDGRPGFISLAADRLSPADVEDIKARFQQAARRPATVLAAPMVVEPMPEPSDVLLLDVIEARLSAGLGNIVAAAMAALMEGVSVTA